MARKKDKAGVPAPQQDNKITPSGKADALAPTGAGEGQGNVASNAAAQKAGEAVQEVKQTRTRRTNKQIDADRLVVAQVALDKQNKILDELFTPENFEALVCAPADIAAIVTGSDVWELDQKDKDSMSKPAAYAARMFMTVDPKWVALLMLGMNIGTVYAGRTAIYLAERKAKKKDKEKLHD